MRTIPARATAILPERAVFARAFARGWLTVSEAGVITILDVGLATLGRVDCGLGRTPHDVALDAAGMLLTCASEDGLAALDVGKRTARWRADGHFEACRLTPDGQSLWAAETHGSVVALTVRDPGTGSVQRQVDVEDPFGDSSVMLTGHPDEHAVIAWLAAGQDGQVAVLADDRGTTLSTRAIEPRDRFPPVFLSPDRYLSASDEVLELRHWPSGEVIAALEWSEATASPDEDPTGSDVQVLPGGFATWSSENGRLYLVDVKSMTVVDELFIAGHGLRTLAELHHPYLADDHSPATDFEYARVGPGGSILSVHNRRQLVASQLDDWR